MTGLTETAENIIGVSEASEEAGSASGQVMSKATELADQAETLRDEVNKFVAQVRTG